MFDAQSLLGGLLKEAISGGNLGNKASLGMGALGVAIAAFEHFSEVQHASTQTADNHSRPAVPPTQIPQPPREMGAFSAPPPLTTIDDTLTPPPKHVQQTALVLIDAMLAAANADGYIDSEEKDKIFQQLKQIDSDQDGFNYVQQRIEHPATLEQVCQSARDPEMAKQIYMVSLLAIRVDTIDEADYLTKLSSCLPVDANVIKQLNEQFQT